MTISFLVTVIAQVLILILIARVILSWLPRIGVLDGMGHEELADSRLTLWQLSFLADLIQEAS